MIESEGDIQLVVMELHSSEATNPQNLDRLKNSDILLYRDNITIKFMD